MNNVDLAAALDAVFAGKTPRLASTSVSQEAVQLVARHLQPLKKHLPNLEQAMMTGELTEDEYKMLGLGFARLALDWIALPDNGTPERPGIAGAAG